jgi:hypothetical protein
MHNPASLEEIDQSGQASFADGHSRVFNAPQFRKPPTCAPSFVVNRFVQQGLQVGFGVLAELHHSFGSHISHVRSP